MRSHSKEKGGVGDDKNYFIVFDCEIVRRPEDRRYSMRMVEFVK